jgi:hypothetical protein
MADETRLDELLTSPLDQPDSFRVWWPLIVGVAVGVAGAIAGYWLASSDDPAAAEFATTTSSTVVTTTLPASVQADEAAFPTGYVAVTDLIAVKPFAAVVVEEALHIAFTTAVRRGFDPDEATPFNGGRWLLATASGAEIESSGTASTFNAPGAFTVVFPWTEGEEPEPTTLTLVEGVTFFDDQGETNVPFTGLPMTVDAFTIADLPVTSVTVDSLTVTEDAAVLTWSSSDGIPVGATFTVFLADQSQNTVGQYYEQGSFFFGGFGEREIPEQTSGAVTMQRDTSFQGPAAFEKASELRVFASLAYTVSFPASAEFDVTDLPIVSR